MKQLLYSTLVLMTMTTASFAAQCGDTGSNKDAAAQSSSDSTTDNRDNVDQRKSDS